MQPAGNTGTRESQLSPCVITGNEVSRIERDLALSGGYLAVQRAEQDGTHKIRRE